MTQSYRLMRHFFYSHHWVIFAVISGGALLQSHAASLSVASPSPLEFKAVGKPSFLKIIGRSSALTGSFDLTTRAGHFEVLLSTLDSGIQKRDEHMKDRYLEISRFPRALLDLDPVAWFPTQRSGPFQGRLTLHGVTRSVSGEAEVTEEQAVGDASKNPPQPKSVQAHFQLHLQDFEIAIPEFAGITVANEVTVSVDLHFAATAPTAAQEHP